MLAEKPILLENGKLNYSFFNQLQAWINDHIGFRSQFVWLRSEIDYQIFHRSPSERVHLGKDGWLFYTLDDNLKIATGEYSLPDETLEIIHRNMSAVQKIFNENGTDFVIVLPPSKVSIYPEYLRIYLRNGGIEKTPDDIVFDHLSRNEDLKIVCLKDTLLQQKALADVYFKTDTHWNEIGAYTAYQKICRDLNEWGIYCKENIEIVVEQEKRYGDLTHMIGRNNEEPFQHVKLINPSAYRLLEDDKLVSELREETNGSAFWCYKNENASNNKKVLIFGDSMFGGWNITELLAENFSQLTFVSDHNMSENIIDTVDPDLVILETTERYIRRLASIEFTENMKAILITLSEDNSTMNIKVAGANYEGCKVAIWSEENDQDDLKWYDCSLINDHWCCSSAVRDHESKGKIYIHAYVFKDGEYVFLSGRDVFLDKNYGKT